MSIPRTRSVRTKIRPKANGRLRPKLATTVARETLDAVELLTARFPVGETIDQLVWAAICQRLTIVYNEYGFADKPFSEWSEKANDPWNWIDEVLTKVLVREGHRFGLLEQAEQERTRTELASAYDTRTACGRFSSLEDFVRLFVAQRACPVCR